VVHCHKTPGVVEELRTAAGAVVRRIVEGEAVRMAVAVGDTVQAEGIDPGAVDNVLGEEEAVAGSRLDGEEDIVPAGAEDNDLVEGIGLVEVADTGLEVDIVLEEEGTAARSLAVGAADRIRLRSQDMTCRFKSLSCAEDRC
jgi:hypothetical protein